MDFRRIQLRVDNNYNPQKNIIASFFVTVITKFDIKLILLRSNSLISQWELFRVWNHDDVIKWNLPFVRGIHRSPVNSPHKGQWRGALMFSLICAWINAWVNNREAGDLGRHRARYDVIAMTYSLSFMVIILTQRKVQVKQFALKKVHVYGLLK